MRKRKPHELMTVVLIFVLFCLTFACLFLICWINSWEEHWVQFPLEALVGFFMFFFGAMFFGGCMSLTEEDKDQK